MENTKTLGEKLRQAHNYYVENREEAFENWVDALVQSRETEMTIASLRGASSYIFMRSSEPSGEIDFLPPFPSSEEVKRIEERIGKKYGMEVKITEPTLCKSFSILFTWGK